MTGTFAQQLTSDYHIREEILITGSYKNSFRLTNNIQLFLFNPNS